MKKVGDALLGNKNMSFGRKLILEWGKLTNDLEREMFLELHFGHLPDPPVKCEMCQDRGFIEIGENGARNCPCQYGYKAHKTSLDKITPQYERLDALLRGDHWEGWPPPSFNRIRDIPGYVDTPTMQAARWMLTAIEEGGQGKALVTTGGTGRGKTLAGLILLKELAFQKYNCYAARFPHLIAMRKNWQDQKDNYFHIMRNLATAEAALLDEVGKETSAGNRNLATETLEEIIDLFYRGKKTLVITSNFPLEVMKEYLTKSCLSRIKKSTGWCTTVEEPHSDADLRGKINAQSNSSSEIF